MRVLIGMLAAAVAFVPAMAVAGGAPATMNVGHGPMVRPGGGWGPGGWTGGVRPMPQPGGIRPGFAGGVHPGVPGGVRPGGWVGHPGFAGRWQGGFAGYRRPFVGYYVPRTWIAPNYYISNWGGWGLSAPAAGYNWYRYYDDAVMVDGAGRVRDWRGGIDWDRRSTTASAGAAYDDGYEDGYDDGFDDGVEYADDAVGYRGDWKRGKGGKHDRDARAYPPVAPGGPLMPPPPMRPGYRYDSYSSAPYRYSPAPGTTVVETPGGATIVTVQTAPQVTTTTTTTTSYETVSAPRRVWHAPARKRVAARGKTLCRC
ncbi:RcnB family protein [Sphingomonas jatrophae]|uniref:Regulator RcnB of Ni and Co efflux n=1 Tax=Sphingomonas jatrophae TaxID=1166337 RepID=A0A1I6LG87_9SPHN|nr:RcnB family protein [Sphingomonas jatrophae]SFS02453.1 regulator RcnB of Ni and Co efflux [Sphingomonas jatrophae]